jgi:2-keto-3-deoxy-L-rhamnonate aldolase RhmA
MSLALVNPAKDRMLADKLALGLIVRVARSPDVARIARATGHDFIFIDGQHGIFSAETVGELIVAAHASGVAPIVRVRNCDDPNIGLWLDAGATGIIVPDVEDADEARRAARAAKFAPIGRRSLPGPLSLFDFKPIPGEEATRRVNEATLLICMVETRRGVANCEEIAAVEGVDVLHVGGVDLRGDLGVAEGSPEVVAAIEHVIASARKHGKFAGVGGDRDPTRLAGFIEHGARFFTSQVDVALLMSAGAEAAGKLRSLRP